jgi:SAM-dependent methyltransferase
LTEIKKSAVRQARRFGEIAARRGLGLYRKYMLPWLLHLAMKNREASRYRSRIIPAARGRVLEVGIGSGLNLPYYSRVVESVTGVDPSAELLAMARRATKDLPFPMTFQQGGAERLALDDRSFDTVVTTWTLCSIPEGAMALSEMRRVLRPGGELLFIEHGLSPDRRVAAWQRRLNPLWNRCTGGCNLDRSIDRLIREAGFAIKRLETGYLIQGPRPMTFHFEGRAERA